MESDGGGSEMLDISEGASADKLALRSQRIKAGSRVGMLPL